ncbi:uncharacterized protein LOC128342483 [Hemicordylus capensis]|uniref:uncharacterized protein LOC128342483 n=1 Tax=Hemicordylus capensis TaxID=884348 RepID=UPI0023041D5E|nr:uncharacterized protein LOC128342483 [Hemicordylus capensis]
MAGAHLGLAQPGRAAPPRPRTHTKRLGLQSGLILMQGFTDRLAALEAAMASLVAPASSKIPERHCGGSTTAAGSAAGDTSEEQAGQGDAALLAAGPRCFPKAREDACRSVEPWSVEALRAIEASLAPRTRATYSRRVAAFQRFRLQVGVGQAWPAPPEHLMQYLVHLRGEGLTVSTMAGQLAALAFYTKSRGLLDHSGDFRVRHMLEGWARETPAQPDQRRPITPDALCRAVQSLGAICSSPYEEALFRAAALVAFYGAFRVGELFPKGSRGTVARVMQKSDLVMDSATVSLRLRFSKTDQWGRGQLVTLHRADNRLMCPVQALGAYMVARGEAEGCLFVHAAGNPLSQYQFWAVMRKAFHVAGVSTGHLSSHSFRIRAALAAANLNYPGAAIQHLGCWQSAAYCRYV